MLTVQIVLFDGFDLLDAIAPYEVFYAAAMNADNAVSVEFVTAEGPRQVASGTNGLMIEASGRLNPVQPGFILVPGASGVVDGDSYHSIPAILGRAMNTELTGMIGQALGRSDMVVATVCGGSLLLALGGLLEGRPAVTHHLGMELLGATGAIPISARIVDAGNLVSGGGVTSGLDVAIYLVERDLGPRIAHAVEQLFEFERRGTVWKEAGLAVGSNKTVTNEAITITADEAPPKYSNNSKASVFDGEWDTVIATPVGKLQVRLFLSTNQGMIQGRAAQGNETVELSNPELKDNTLTWLLRITKPMRLNLKFEVVAEGDHMSGTAKAGMLPASKLTGRRVKSTEVLL